MQKKYLMTPGPTPVPAEVLLAQAGPMIHHRTPDFSAALLEAVEGLKYVFETGNDVLLFACSGTGVMESAFVNCFCAGDTVIVCRNGKFGDRMKSDRQDLRAERHRPALRVDRGRRAGRHRDGARGEPRRARRHRHAVRDVRGVLNDVEAIGEIVARLPRLRAHRRLDHRHRRRRRARPTSGASTWS